MTTHYYFRVRNETFNLNVPNLMFRLSKNFGEKGRPPCAQVSRNAWEDIRRMTKKMAHNREKMRAKLNVLKFILVLYLLIDFC
jgi:hypothetical protein